MTSSVFDHSKVFEGKVELARSDNDDKKRERLIAKREREKEKER